MKKIIRLSSLFILLVINNSCDKNYDESSSSPSNFSNKVEIINGRLDFKSQADFKKAYEKLMDASENELSNYFDPLYQKGFYSLRPIVTENNENFIYEHYIKLKDNTISSERTSEEGDDYFDYLDDIEDVVGDDVFAAFLNSDAEILIEDKIYKYTDVGLFISKEDRFNILSEYLDEKSISKDLAIQTNNTAKLNFKNEFPLPGEITISTDIKYFRASSNENPISDSNDPDGGGGGGGSGSGSGGGGNNTNDTGPPVGTGGTSGTGSTTGYTQTPGVTDPSYISFLNNLQDCDPHSGIFGDLFGDNNVCIDHYENRRRVKTKAYNYNYLVVYHLGVKCVHQYKGWSGLYRTEANYEVRLFVEAAQFEYDRDRLLNNALINNQNAEKAYFLNNNRILYQPNTITFNNQFGTPLITYFNLNTLPPIFIDDLTFEFFGTGSTYVDTLIQNGINSTLGASQLNSYFYNALYSNTTDYLRNALGNSSYVPPSNRTFVAKFPENGKMIIQKSYLDRANFMGIRQKTFDWGAEIRINASSGGGDWNITGGAGNQLIRPTNFKVKIIGAVQGFDGRWHGSKFRVGLD